MKTCDFLIIGGGVIGLSIAAELKKHYSSAKIILLEKEKACGMHASARNSGVLHAGFYYTANTLKAKLTQQGNQAWTAYCRDKKLPINPCGKLVVARNESELEFLRILLARGNQNGVPLKEISERDAKEMEPKVKTFQKALYSPTTSTIDPVALMASYKNDALASGIEIHEGEAYVKVQPKSTIMSTRQKYSCGYVINCAGLYADKIAHDFNFAKNYRILPFKGLYLNAVTSSRDFRMHIYPVPDLNYPFLGVHVTVAVDGHSKIGPTAIPAFWRENYGGWENFKLVELFEILFRETELFFFSSFNFAHLAKEEIKRYSHAYLVRLASELAHGIRIEDYPTWGKTGIRAQLVDIKNRRLEMDFVVQSDERSCHVLNAVSPGLTCAIPFAKYVCDQISS